jgi:hypothetical protein
MAQFLLQESPAFLVCQCVVLYFVWEVGEGGVRGKGGGGGIHQLESHDFFLRFSLPVTFAPSSQRRHRSLRLLENRFQV